ncbi:MAG: ABC transporter ATP-binding protein [Acidilobaceae archaeon]
MSKAFAIVAEGLAKQYSNGTWGAIDISFEVKRGSVCVLLGPNGAGKTTTIGILTTLLRPTRGRALVEGYDVVKESQKVREISALVPQDGRPDGYWTPKEAVKWYLAIRGASLSTAEREADYWIEHLDLSSVKHVPIMELSGGQRKRVLLAMALASNAHVLFLDEPTSGLDIEGKHLLLKTIRETARDGRTVVITTHDIEEAEIVADFVVLINKGKTVTKGTLNSLIESLPYRCKVVARSEVLDRVKASASLLLGDSVTFYFSSCEEAESIARTLGLFVKKVGLFDVYLYYINEGAQKWLQREKGF